MSGMAKAALAAALLNCGIIQASAEQSGRWLTDPISGCAVFDAAATADASVRWTGACVNGYADGVGTATFVLSSPSGYASTRPMQLAGSYPIVGATGDFNSDGHRDVLFTSDGSSQGTALFGRGDGTFVAVGESLSPCGGVPLVVDDFNGDGYSDLFAASERCVSKVLGAPDGGFWSPDPTRPTYSLGFAVAVIGDFDRDGQIDLAAVSQDSTQIWRGVDDETFDPRPERYTAHNGSYGAVAIDADRDLNRRRRA